MSQIEIYFDGASRNNPGPAGVGGVIKEDGRVVKKYHRYLGKKTNNEAEYLAALLGIRVVKKLGLKPTRLVFIGDSSLIIEQLAGRFKIRNDRLKELYWQIREEILGLGSGVDFRHIKREKNRQADSLANQAIKEGLKREWRRD